MDPHLDHGDGGMTMSFGRLSLLASLILGIGFAPRFASAEKVRVVVEPFGGKHGAKLRSSVIRALGKRKKQVAIVASADWDKAALDASANLSTPEGLGRVGAELGVAAVIRGELQYEKKRYVARIQLIATASGEVLAEMSARSKSRSKVLKQTSSSLWKKLGVPLLGAKPPAPPAEPPPTVSAEPPPPAPVVEKKRLVLLEVKGTKAKELESFLEGELSRAGGYELIIRDEAERVSKALDVDLDDEEGRMEVARKLNVTAFVSVDVDDKDRGYTAEAIVFNGRDGEKLDEVKAESRRTSSLARELRRNLSDAIERCSVPGAAPPIGPGPTAGAEPEKEPESEPDTSASTEKKSSREPGLRSASPLELAAAFEWGLRFFDYNDPLLGELRPYENLGVTAVRARLTWYPAAHFSSGFASNLGVDADLGFGVGLSTQVEDGSGEYSTGALNLAVSAKGRLPLGKHELGLLFGYALDSFTIEGAEALLPSVSYSALRVGASARFFLGEAISLAPEFGWRFVLSSGDLASDAWFPRSTSGGLDAGLTFGVVLVSHLEAQLRFGYRRYFHSMNPEPGDAKVAGGSLDQFFTGALGLAFYLD